MKKILNPHNLQGKTVSLIGMGPSIGDYIGETLTQEYDPNRTDEVWTINMVSNAFRSDMVIWMDDLEDQRKFKPGLIEALRRYGAPVLTSTARRDLVPTSYDFPLDEVAAISIPVFAKPYLTNGVAMAVGYALWKGVKAMRIYGCDFTYPNRNFAEEGRACVEAWIVLASLRGMQVHLSPSTSLFDVTGDRGIYGYTVQPEINLPNGGKFKYVKKEADPTMGAYVATDSSPTGARNAIPAPVPGSPGHANVVAGSADSGRGGAAEPPAAPAPEHGAGVADQDRHGRPEAAHLAGLNGGSPAGDVPPAA